MGACCSSVADADTSNPTTSFSDSPPKPMRLTRRISLKDDHTFFSIDPEGKAISTSPAPSTSTSSIRSFPASTRSVRSRDTISTVRSVSVWSTRESCQGGDGGERSGSPAMSTRSLSPTSTRGSPTLINEPLSGVFEEFRGRRSPTVRGEGDQDQQKRLIITGPFVTINYVKDSEGNGVLVKEVDGDVFLVTSQPITINVCASETASVRMRTIDTQPCTPSMVITPPTLQRPSSLSSTTSHQPAVIQCSESLLSPPPNPYAQPLPVNPPKPVEPAAQIGRGKLRRNTVSSGIITKEMRPVSVYSGRSKRVSTRVKSIVGKPFVPFEGVPRGLEV